MPGGDAACCGHVSRPLAQSGVRGNWLKLTGRLQGSDESLGVGKAQRQ
jgi:hypothetical protein